MNYLEIISYIIFIKALIEVAFRRPFKADAVSFIICPAAFVNIPISISKLSYSMFLIILKVTVVEISALKI
jgi:hypothetical protein